jgi:hypothetical protein
MNPHDKQNLEFILTRSVDQLAHWFRSVQQAGDADELQYAVELLMAARNQVEMELLEITDHDCDNDVHMAQEYLQRFRLQ